MFRELTPVQRGVDALIAGGYALVFVVVPLLSSSAGAGLLGAAACFTAALVLRRWAPPLALGLAWAGALVQMLGQADADVLDAAVPPVVYACAAYGTRATRWAAFTSALVGAGVAGVYSARSSFAVVATGLLSAAPDAVRGFVTFAVLTAVTLLLAWTLGVLVATSRQSRSNRRQALEAGRQAATEQERTRIARDMHDVVAHSLAVVIAQSDGARLLRRTDPEAVDEALETIGSVSRAALADVRVLLQQLRYEGTTTVQPGLGDLDALVEQLRASGLPVELRREGDTTGIGTAQQLAAYRIVQESLTNALRHGLPGAPAAAALTRTPHGLEVEVRSAIDPARPPRTAPGGHGLIGMRERASAVQGDLRAGPEGEVFRVRAFLPAGTTAALPVLSGAGDG